MAKPSLAGIGNYNCLEEATFSEQSLEKCENLILLYSPTSLNKAGAVPLNRPGEYATTYKG